MEDILKKKKNISKKASRRKLEGLLQFGLSLLNSFPHLQERNCILFHQCLFKWVVHRGYFHNIPLRNGSYFGSDTIKELVLGRDRFWCCINEEQNKKQSCDTYADSSFTSLVRCYKSPLSDVQYMTQSLCHCQTLRSITCCRE